ncbi:MAG TPA: hypothetical protein VM240_03010 [Verrucomicrobiae bacterium]|nr:hypothetical protein [Verrucomicrobiae bacterium]
MFWPLQMPFTPVLNQVHEPGVQLVVTVEVWPAAGVLAWGGAVELPGKVQLAAEGEELALAQVLASLVDWPAVETVLSDTVVVVPAVLLPTTVQCVDGQAMKLDALHEQLVNPFAAQVALFSAVVHAAALA